MFLRSTFVAAAAALLASAPAVAVITPNHVWDLNNSLDDSLGGPSLSLAGTAALSANGVSFGNPSHSGLVLTDAIDAFTSGQTFSLELAFQFTQNASWYRVLNMLNTPGGEQGLYVRNGGLAYYEDTTYTGSGVFNTDTMHHIVFTRDASSVSVYLDGASSFNGAPPYASSQITDDLLFFIDNGGEESAGYVDFIRSYDYKLSDSDASALYNNGSPLDSGSLGASPTPEPATWMMSIIGFGAIGGSVRYRRRTQATATA